MPKVMERRQVYEAVMDQIRSDIRQGQLGVGDRLESVRDLATRLGVGQSSVREAVRILSYTGLLHVKHGGGIFVSQDMSRQDQIDPIDRMPAGERASLRQVMELRLAIEPLAARWAAERATPVERADIQARCDQVQDALRRPDYSERAEFQEADLDFHLAIVRAAHNPLVIEALLRVQTQLRFGRHITARVSEMRESALHFHPQITQSILARDATRAESFSRAHVDDIIWWLEAHDAHRPSSGADDQGATSRSIGLLGTALTQAGPS